MVMAKREAVIHWKHVPLYIRSAFHYELSQPTVDRWRRVDPLPLPATADEIDTWFIRRIEVKRKIRRSFTLKNAQSPVSDTVQ